jgi:nucleoside-diphosphate-sugar epimerase
LATIFVTGGSGFVGGALLDLLRERGESVRALARTPAAEAEVVSRGAEAVRGDLTDLSALADGMADAELVVHAAGRLPGGPRVAGEMHRVNVEGTRTVLAAAAKLGVPRLVYLSTEQVVLGPEPLIDATESVPYPERPAGVYAATKGEAERLVLAANSRGLATVAVRPRLVWGLGDTTVLPQLAAAARTGRLRWIDGGNYLVSTTHVGNVAEGVVAAAERGRGGSAYFVTDGAPVRFRDFASDLLATQGVQPPSRSVSRSGATAMARASDLAWRFLPLRGRPSLTREVLRAIGETCTIRDDKARHELGYEGKVTRVRGLAELRAGRNPASDPAG